LPPCRNVSTDSSGGIQTEAALKQFGLLEVNGRGDDRRLRLSELALRLLPDQGIDAAERHKLIKQSALTPRTHRELWESWGSVLPEAEVRRYLTKVKNPAFNAKGAKGLIDEYRKTISYLELIGSEPMPANRTHRNAGGSSTEAGTSQRPRPQEDAQATPIRTTPAMKENEINVLFVGNYLSVSAFVDRAGLGKLMKILEANRAILEGGKED
jgi:hypothetical protein